MQYHVSKLDSRYTGAQWFYCRVQTMNHNGEDKILNFRTLRNWCWETFGSSCEVDLVRNMIKHGDVEPQWAWKRDETHNTYYIYLTWAAYTTFALKWTNQ